MKLKELLAIVDKSENISICYRSTNGYINYIVADIEKSTYDGKYDDCQVVNVGANLYAVLDIEVKIEEEQT